MRSTTSVISARYRLCSIHIALSILVYALINLLSLERNFEFMVVYGGISIVFFTLILLSELRYKGLTLLMIFMVGAFMRLLIPTIQMALEANVGGKFSYSYDYTAYVFPCTVAMNIYYMMFIIALTHFAKDKYFAIKFDALFNIPFFNTFVILFFIIGSLVRLIPDNITFMDSLRRMLLLLPRASLLLLTFYCAYNKKQSSHRLFKFLICYEIFYSTFFDFYKGKVMEPIFFFILYYYLKCKNEDKNVLNTRMIALVTSSFIFMYLFVFPFITTKRVEANWDPGTNMTFSSYSNIDIIKQVLFGKSLKYVDEFKEESSANDRQNSIPPNALFYRAAIKEGFNPIMLEAPFALPIPRWLGGEGSLPSKTPGYMVDAYMKSGNYTVSDLAETFSAGYMGAFASSYFWGGWIGVLIMTIFNGWVIVKMLEYSLRHPQNLFALLLLLDLVMGALSCYEEVTDGGFIRARGYVLLLIPAVFTNLLFGKRKKNKISTPKIISNESIN